MPLPLYEPRRTNYEVANNGNCVNIINIVTRLEVVNRGALVLFPAGARIFSLFQTIQIRYETHKAYYSMSVGDKAAEA